MICDGHSGLQTCQCINSDDKSFQWSELKDIRCMNSSAESLYWKELDQIQIQ